MAVFGLDLSILAMDKKLSPLVLLGEESMGFGWRKLGDLGMFWLRGIGREFLAFGDEL